MDIYKAKNTEIRLSYDLISEQVVGKIYNKKKCVGYINDDKMYVDTKCEDIHSVIDELESLRGDLNEYIKTWSKALKS